MRLILPAVAALIIVAGCGSSAERVGADPVGQTTLDAPGSATLNETCPQVEAELPEPPPVGDPTQYQDYLVTLERLREAGDTETRNALDLLIPTVETAAGDPTRGNDLLDLRSALLTALGSLADRCKATGSSAFQ